MCDTVVSISEDGVLFAKNSDRDPNEAQFLEWVPSLEFEAGSTLRCTWIDIPQVASTHAMVLSRPWWMWGAEIGANEHGVAIGNEAVFTNDSIRRSRRDQPGLLGMDLLRLGLERGRSAEDALGVVIDLLERYGQGGSCSLAHPGFTYDNSYVIADPTGAFVLETAGRAWATERVQMGTSRSISNALSIEAFSRHHSDRLRSRLSNAHLRSAATAAIASRSKNVGNLAAALRDHGVGTAPRFSLLTGAMSAPCMHAGGLMASNQSVASWVSDLSDGPSHWVTATAAPCLSLFKPVALHVPIDLGTRPTGHFDEESMWWRHEVLHRMALRDLPRAVALIVPERDRIESEWFKNPPSSGMAFNVADDTTQGWIQMLSDVDMGETRPWWLRAIWRNLDRQAALPTPSPGGEYER